MSGNLTVRQCERVVLGSSDPQRLARWYRAALTPVPNADHALALRSTRSHCGPRAGAADHALALPPRRPAGVSPAATPVATRPAGDLGKEMQL